MNQKIIFFLFIAVFFVSSTLLGNNDPVLATSTKSNKPAETSMHLEINGTIKLYSVLKEDIDAEDVEAEIQAPSRNIAFMDWVLDMDKDFYLGLGGQVEAITPSNFKRVAKKYFVATPELMKRIGKRGFRYKNLPSMILYYNKMMAKEGGLTKADVVASTN